MTTRDVYEKLAEHLDNLPVGFPKTKSGVELKILRQLFTKDEADMATHLTYMPETVDQIAQRIGRNPAEIEPLLEQMVNKGLIFHSRKGEKTTYSAAIFIVGIYERQGGTLTKELADDFDQYMDEALREELISGTETVQFRVIPVASSITPEMGVAPYDDVREMVKKQSKIAIAECICKKKKALQGEGCDNPREVCMVFSGPAWGYIELGIAREITKEEALEILDKAEEAGLVCSPSNDQKGFVVCLCCSCCCDILDSMKKVPNSIVRYQSNYYALVDSELCTGCETCLDRCQMDAIKIEEGIAVIDLDYCIGCGLCVTSCPSEALSLKRKDESESRIPPENYYKLYEQSGMERLARRSK